MNASSSQQSSPRLGMSPRIAESIAADLRQRILRSAETDIPLPRQEVLMRQYGVSGPSLREALRILEAEGLITVRRGKFGGAYVHKPSWSSAAFALAMSMQGQNVTLTDLAESLLTLEPMCAAACAARKDRKKKIVPALRRNLEETEKVVGLGEAYSTAARGFHDIMVAGVPSQTMRLVVRTLVTIWSIQEETWAATVNAAHEYPSEKAQRKSLHTHERLLEHIDSGDADAASSLSARHLRATQAIVLERFGGEIVDSSSLVAVQAFKSL